MGIIHVKLFEIWTNGSVGDVVLKKVYGQQTTNGGGLTKTIGNHNSSP